MRDEDIKYIHELEERVQELEEEVECYQSGRNVAVITKMKMDELEKQNQHYREAIEKAIGGCRYTNSEVAYILQKALEELE